jgi:hypothetical protein
VGSEGAGKNSKRNSQCLLTLRHRGKLYANESASGLHGQLQFRQRAVNERDGNGSFPDCGSHAFHVAGTNIAHGEDSGKACFEHVGRTRSGPRERPRYAVQVAASENEPFVVEGETIR